MSKIVFINNVHQTDATQILAKNRIREGLRKKIIRNKNKFTSYFHYGLTQVSAEIGRIRLPRMPKKNFLNKKDISRAKQILKGGEIVLVGQLKTISSLAIKGVITHSTFYLGNDCFIHSDSRGVCIINSKEIFEKYDTMVILKPNDEEYASKVEEVKKFLINQVGKNYDITFNNENLDRYYCSELIALSLYQANINSGIDPFMDDIIHPEYLTEGNFNVLFTSHNIVRKNKQLYFTEGSRIYERFRKRTRNIS